MGILTIREFEDETIIDITHNALIERLTVVECKNPFCDCGSFKMLCISKEEINDDSESLAIVFEGNIFSKSICMIDAADPGFMATYKKYYNYLSENLETSDWDIISDIFQFNKIELIDAFDFEQEFEQEEKYEYVFGDVHLADVDLRIEYHDIFPWCQYFTVEKNGIEYYVTEEYCKKLTCDCSMVGFALYNKDKHICTFDYDYTNNELSDNKYTWVVDQILENYNFVNVKLTVRNLTVRCLFGEHISKPENLSMLKEQLLGVDNSFKEPYLNVQKNIGRNDKCPCGSGKKFKRCCLKKN